MDDLVQYIVRELSFEGDLGCEITRFETLIGAFYRTTAGQGVDGSFFAFAWSIVLQEPSIYVGILPPGDHSEVYVAPPPRVSKKNSGKARETADADQVASLEPVENSKSQALEQLKQSYGERLRIAVDSQVLRATLAGPHARSSTLSPMVYTVLQLVARARETGISTVDLSNKTGYDSKNCAYLIRQLQEMDLIVKLARAGIGGNFCVLKHFYDTSPMWRRIRDEGDKQKDTVTIKPGEQMAKTKESINFGPIDAFHLADLNLLRGRIIKLLLNSPGHTHVAKDLVITLGFENPTKTERRFFSTRLNELINLGVIEKVTLTNSSTGKTSTQCIRLVKTDTEESGKTEAEVVPVQASSSTESDGAQDKRFLRGNRTIQWQILEALDKAGPKGMTRTEISGLLDGFDLRIVEHMLQGFDKSRPNSNMLDFGVMAMEETYGRERRHRWFTFAGYKALLSQENISEAEHELPVDLANTGGFTEVSPELFYDTSDQLHQHQDTDVREQATRNRRKPPKNPILPDGTVKRGRPRKNQPGPSKRKREGPAEDDEPDGQVRPAKRAKTSAAGGDIVIDAGQDTPIAEPTPRKRGRPPKRKPEGEPPATPTPRKRGRPPKNRTPAIAEEQGVQDRGEQTLPITTPSASAQEAIPEAARDTDGLPVLSYPKVSEQPVRQGGFLEADTPRPAGDSRPTPPPELEPPTLESREPIQRSQADANGDSTSVPIELSTAIITTKTVPGSRKPNMSHARRDNEFYRVIQEFGGITIVNVKEFGDAHVALLGTLAEAGKPASGPPGTRVDRRTIDTTLSKLEKDGRVKILKTTLVTPIFTTRKITIAYLSHLEEEKVQAFMSTLTQGSPSRTAANAPKKSEQPHDLSSQQPPSIPSPIKSVGTDDSHDTAVRESIIADVHGNSVPQMYGFIMGKIARARKLHLLALLPFGSGNNGSPNIISNNARVLHLDYFLRDITIADYCSLFSVRSPIEGLDVLVHSESGPSPALWDVPENILLALGLGASRSRNRLMELLSILEDLRLLTPLQQSQSETPFLTCEQVGTHPSRFDVVPQESWNTSAANLAPKYWHIRPSGPAHLWASPASPPPFWKTFSLRTSAEGEDFWNKLKEVCLDPSSIEKVQIQEEVPTGDQPNLVIRGSLRRDAGWLKTYYMSSHQENFLNKFLDKPPLSEDEEAKARLAHLSWVTLAPERVIREFYSTALDRRAQQLQRRKKKEKSAQDKKRASVAQKAARGKDKRVKLWDHLLTNSHPALVGKPLPPRVQRVRSDYLKAPSVADEKHWEQSIAAAIQEEATNHVSHITNRPPRPKGLTAIPAPPGSGAPADKSIVQLINEQNKMKNFSETPVKKRKGKEKSEGSGKRRYRFKWNPDFDELAKDASVIIKARCRSGQRMDWSAVTQVFPVLAQNSVRQRMDALTKDSQPTRAYLQRLEDAWYSLWMRNRETPQLPDPNPKSATDFDLVAHLTFLRAHIDKPSLGIGSDSLALPSSIEELLLLDIKETQPVTSAWDFMWNTVTEDRREKQLFLKSMLVDEINPSVGAPYEADEMYVAETAVKMVVSTPNERYTVETANQLLRRFGDDAVSSVAESMLERGIFSKIVRDAKKPKPGRSLKISDQNQGLLNGPIPRETFRDASSLEELWIEQDEEETAWREWPLLASDGDMAALIELVSENKIDFKIDTTQAKESRTSVEYNSKKADDVELETALHIRSHDLSWSSIHTETLEEPPSLSSPTVPGAGHGFTRDERSACCSMNSSGLVDCQDCLDGEIESLPEYLDEAEKGCALQIVLLLNDAGPRGIGKKEVIARVQELGHTDVCDVMDKVTSRLIPLFFWTGYLSVVLVSSTYLQTWSLVLPASPVMVKPRRWSGINGSQMPEAWEAGLRAVMGMIVSRPAITQAELRWRMQNVYDRLELEDLVRYLQEHKVIERRGLAGSKCVGLLDDEEESSVWLLLGQQHWYHV